ncbi:MAG: restriction endonuclease subunit S [Acetobacterium woodii]|nr:restriction endonuclease subunit S [Acetobacterium woodii]
MVKLNEIVALVSGTPQFRITETRAEPTPSYLLYSQTDLADDLVGILSEAADNKRIWTRDQVNTLASGDAVFSLISGTGTMVREAHQGYLYTQNYVKLLPGEQIDRKFLVYLLNENSAIKKQLLIGLQGSQVLKYSLRQIKDLEIPTLPPFEKQKIIGEIYFNQLRLQALKNRVANLETIMRLHKLEEETKYD